MHHVQRISLFILLILIGVSCMTEEERAYQAREDFAESKSQMLKHRGVFFDYAKSFAGEKLYSEVYQKMNDSIKVWAESSLGYYTFFAHDNKIKTNYQVDSLLCFNPEKDMCITAILMQQTLCGAVQDDIWYFYGIKIKGVWYFFDEHTLVIPRRYYQEDIHTPLSFETLQLLSTKYRFRRYLKKDGRGNLEINDKFFNYFTSGAWCGNCKTKQQWDSAYLRQVKLNWSKRNKH